MSHLFILPTALSDPERLADVLVSEGYDVERNGYLRGFGGDRQAYTLKATSASGIHLAWTTSADGSALELLADLERQGAAGMFQQRLQRIVRLYALSKALDTVNTSPLLQGAHKD